MKRWSTRSAFLNRRDASRYRDLETFLPGLEIFLKIQNLPNFTFNKTQIVEFSQVNKILNWNSSKTYINFVFLSNET